MIIVIALVEPTLKPHLIDRYLASAEQGGIRPIICLNKADLVDPVEFQPLVGFYNQLGVPTFLTSATTGQGLAPLKRLLKDRQSVFSGQSGVGKSSLLNAIQPGLELHVRTVSDVNQKGRHTTTTAQLLRLDQGGWVVDTPGIRQFDLWNILPEEVEGFFAEFRPLVPLCAVSRLHPYSRIALCRQTGGRGPAHQRTALPELLGNLRRKDGRDLSAAGSRPRTGGAGLTSRRQLLHFP